MSIHLRNGVLYLMTFIVTIPHVQLPEETHIVVETERRLTERSEPHNRHGNHSALV